MPDSVADREAEITVAVVSYNTRALLDRCLTALHPDVQTGTADVWVVDNASTDGSAALVREAFPWVHLIASESNLGFGRAVNAVAARTCTPWLAPANADVRVEPGAVDALLTAGCAHPGAAVIAPRLILPEGMTQQSVYPFPTLPFTLAFVLGLTRRSRRLARHWCIDGGFDPDRERDVAWAIGAFLLVRRHAWEQVGGFDEAQWMYAEDLDLGWRLQRAGWSARYLPSARVRHDESAATTAVWGDGRHARWHASSYAWMMRRRGLPITRLIAVANVLGFLLQAAVAAPGALRRRPGARERLGAALSASRAHRVGLRSRRYLATVT